MAETEDKIPDNEGTEIQEESENQEENINEQNTSDTDEIIQETEHKENENGEKTLETEPIEETNQPTPKNKKSTKTAKLTKTLKIKAQVQAKPKQKQTRKKIYQQPQTIEEWAKARKIYPDQFTYTDDGDLKSAPIKPNDLEKVIVLPSYQPATLQHTKEYFETKRAEVVEPGTEFSKARRRLNEMIAAYKAGKISTNDVLDFNQQVHQAECRINDSLKMPRKIVELTKFTTIKQSDLTFKWHDHTHMISDTLFMEEYTTIPMKALWMPKPVQESESQEGGGETNSRSEDKNQEDDEKKKRQIGAIIGRRKAMAFAGV
jgi:hypothetical protein